MSNLPMKNNIFRKFINFFRNIFTKKKKKLERSIYDNSELNNIKTNFSKEGKIREISTYDNNKLEGIHELNDLNNIKVNFFKEDKIKEIIDIIEKEPSTLEKLDVNKLKVIDNYYKEKIIKYKKKLSNT